MFRPEVIGDDLKESLLTLLNKVKEQLTDPEFMQLCNIVSIYKGKGDQMKLENDRGIFLLNIIRMIKDRMILNDISETVEESMSESQVGARKKRGIRNHLFVLYSIINSVVQKESLPVDIQIYDLKQCFDSLWLVQCCNYLYEAGVTNDKLAMIYEGNMTNKISVKLPGEAGVTDSAVIEECVLQGGGLGPTLCSNSVDRVGKESISRKEHLYK